MNYFNMCAVFVLSVSLSACSAVAQKTGETEGELATADTAPSTTAPSVSNIAPVAPIAAAQVSGNSDPSEISRLQAQVTALQEQTIKITADTGALLKMTQLLLAQKQVQALQGETKNAVQSTPMLASTETDNKSLKELLSRMDELAMSPQGAYGLVSSYTASRQWILIRFDRNTGETWLADSSGWNTLSESDELAISQYDIHVVRGDQDQKGYVAARIDQRTGETWWLNQREWVKYE